MTESATKFPLGQRLLLAPLAVELNKKTGGPQPTPEETSPVLQGNHASNEY